MASYADGFQKFTSYSLTKNESRTLTPGQEDLSCLSGQHHNMVPITQETHKERRDCSACASFSQSSLLTKEDFLVLY